MNFKFEYLRSTMMNRMFIGKPIWLAAELGQITGYNTHGHEDMTLWIEYYT
jgi:hypothetical protein